MQVMFIIYLTLVTECSMLPDVTRDKLPCHRCELGVILSADHDLHENMSCQLGSISPHFLVKLEESEWDNKITVPLFN